MAFLARERSEVREGKRGLSWFSRKVPKSVGSLQSDLMLRTSEARAAMLPEVDWKALVRG